jgi:phospholipase C
MLFGQLGLPIRSAAQGDINNDAAFRLNEQLGQSAKGTTGKSPSGALLADPKDLSSKTQTPIKHVILIIGENRTFDHVFATYQPPTGQSVKNLLSERIVKSSGSPGPKAGTARQWQASDTTSYSIDPKKTSPYAELPAMNTDGAPTTPDFPSASAAETIEPALPLGDYDELANGGTGLPKDVVDTRFPFTVSGADVNSFLPGISGPFGFTDYISYDDYASSPVHRFFQMWQQLDCNASKATANNPSGC